MKWQVRLMCVALIASVTVILHGFFSIHPTTQCTTLRKETEVQYRFAPQETLSSSVLETLESDHEPHEVTGRPINSFLSPYHRYYPLNCTALFTGGAAAIQSIHSKVIFQRDSIFNGSFPVPSDRQVGEWLWDCDDYKRNRRYPTRPMSTEEEEFPIAYVIVAHKDAAQIERLLRSIYQPQNVYCLHPDSKSSANFMYTIRRLASCFPDNIFVASYLADVQWGDFSRLMADIYCMEDLLQHPVKWKYLLNLCGQDFPLKTNLELVRQMKAYKGKNYIEGEAVGPDLQNFGWRTRFHFYSNSTDGYTAPLNSGLLKTPPPFNITVYKGDNYMVATREFIDFIVNDPIAQTFLQWCNDTYLPEETFPNSLHRLRNAPGGDTHEMGTSHIRFRKWAFNPDNPTCRGKYVRELCIFECNYLEHLYNQPHLFVNKFHYDYDPVTMQCIEEMLDHRSNQIRQP